MTRYLGFKISAVVSTALALMAVSSNPVLAGNGAKTGSSAASVSITTPTSGATEPTSFTSTGSASTTARRASITSVQVSVDGGAYQPASGTTSWSYATGSLATGGHTLTAKATDSAGNTSTASISVTVATSSGGGASTASPPTSTIIWPRYAGTVVSGTYTLTGSSSDATYSITKVQWSIDGAAVASMANASQLSYAWDTTRTTQGSHTVTYTTWNSAGASSSASLPISVGTATIKRVAVILYNFSDQAPPTTPQQVFDWTFGSTRSVAGYYQEESFGRLLLGGANNAAGDVFGFFTIPYTYPTSGTCDFTSWESSALQQATAAGFSAASYDVYMLTAAVPSSCGSGSATDTQDRVPWNNPQTADDWIAFAGHEVGHSFGIWHHAGSWICTDSSGHYVQVGGTCSTYEYGDPYDIMGMGNVQHMNGYEKAQLGFFRAGNTQTVTTSGTYTLAPLTAPSTGVQLIRVPIAYDASGSPTDFYYLEYRQPAAYDVPIPNVTDYDGVLIREAPDYSVTTTYSHLVDTTPGSMTYPGVHDNFDAPLKPGMYFQDMSAALSITTVSAGSTGATIKVTFGTPVCVRVAPSISIGPASQSGAAGSTLEYSVKVANNDSPACGPSNLTVSASLPPGFTQSPAGTTLSGLYPSGATSGWLIDVTSPGGTASGSYGFSETVTNASSGASVSAAATAVIQ